MSSILYLAVKACELDVKAKTPTLGDSTGLSHVSEAGKNLSVTSVTLLVGPCSLYPSKRILESFEN
jgi:hypothetical protein